MFKRIRSLFDRLDIEWSSFVLGFLACFVLVFVGFIWWTQHELATLRSHQPDLSAYDSPAYQSSGSSAVLKLPPTTPAKLAPLTPLGFESSPTSRESDVTRLQMFVIQENHQFPTTYLSNGGRITRRNGSIDYTPPNLYLQYDLNPRMPQLHVARAKGSDATSQPATTQSSD